MGPNAQERPRSTFRKVLKFACACLLLAAALPYFPTCHPTLPDLSTCTRIDVRYAGGALNYFFPSTSIQKGVFSEEERDYIQSYDRWTVTDQEQIRVFAQQVSQGTYTYLGWRWSLLMIAMDPPTKIVGYRPRGGRVPLSVYGRSEIRVRWRLFSCDAEHGLSLACLDPPGLKPLRARWDCARHICYLIYQGLWESGQTGRPHLDPNHWCDTIVERYRNQRYVNPEIASEKIVRRYPDSYVAGVFTCPSIHACPDAYEYRSRTGGTSASSQSVDTWTSDYAMNPNCREDSPEDMVFLFESRPGWNQHGGPELFAFDNHDPRGGLVMLNDGTVKFIRTEDELKQLRWK